MSNAEEFMVIKPSDWDDLKRDVLTWKETAETFEDFYRKTECELDDLQLRLNASEARSSHLAELVRKIQVRLEAYIGDEAEMSMDSMRLMLAYANEALFYQCAPATDEQGAELAREALRTEKQRVVPVRFNCLACGGYHEGNANLPCPKMTPYSGNKP